MIYQGDTRDVLPTLDANSVAIGGVQYSADTI